MTKDQAYNAILKILSEFPVDGKKLEVFKKLLAEILGL